MIYNIQYYISNQCMLKKKHRRGFYNMESSFCLADPDRESQKLSCLVALRDVPRCTLKTPPTERHELKMEY